MANLRITELDFDTIKSNLKEFLKNYTADDGAPYFTDFDFEGSGLSILLDVLSYNTHYNAYLASMVINDMFLDSAVKRASAVSIAKHLGYTPVSAKGARAMLDFTVTNPTNNPNFLTLEKYTPFSTSIDGTSYMFVNLNSKTIQPNVGTYTFNDIEVVEGIPLNYVFSVDVPSPAEKYVIPNENIDTSTIQVIVQNSVTDTTQTVYTLAEDTLDVDGTSEVYFLEESATGKYQIFFGDGILGKKLSRNNLVIVNYLISSGTVGNVSGSIRQLFSCGTTIGGGEVVGTITATTNSHGGTAKEGIESIRFRAPRYASSQNRAVTGNDYKALIEKYYPLVESVSVWGGEENNPPKYGKVIISLKPYEGYEVTQETRDNIKALVLQNKQVLSVTPEFITPDYFYVNISTNIKYDSAKTTFTATQIKNLAVTAIQNYFLTDLQKFNKDFIFSKLSRTIDALDDSIVGNLMSVKLQRRIEPLLGGKNNNYVGGAKIQFKNGLQPGTLTSTRFVVSVNGQAIEAILKDIPNDVVPNNIGSGTLYLVKADTGMVLSKNYGTINYGTGDVTITNLALIGYPVDTTDVRLTATIQEEFLDIAVSKNQIILLDDSTLNSDANRSQGLTVNTIAI
jgi:hypothetical protein